MRVTRSTRHRMVIAIGASIVVVAAMGIAQARTAVTPNVTCTTAEIPPAILADGIAVNTVNTNVDPTKLRTKDAVEVVHICNTGAPGFDSTWHHHAGPVIVNVTSGSLTFYSPSNCTGTTVGPGQAYLEPTGDPVRARNLSGQTAATWITTQIIPVGAELSYPEPPTICGP